MKSVEILGIVGGALTTGSALPQIFKIIKTKHAEDVSSVMFIFLAVGMFLWLLYGVATGSAALIIWNVVGMVLNMVVVYFKLKYSNKK